MKKIILGLIAVSSINAYGLEGPFLDSDQLPKNVCSLVQREGAESTGKEVLNICPGFRLKNSKTNLFVGSRGCINNVRRYKAPKVVFCSGFSKPFYLSAASDYVSENSEMGAFMLGSKPSAKRRSKLKEVAGVNNAELWREGVAAILAKESAQQDCAVFSMFGEEEKDFGSLGGASIEYIGEQEEGLQFSLQGKIAGYERSSLVMCRDKSLKSELQVWNMVGRVTRVIDGEEAQTLYVASDLDKIINSEAQDAISEELKRAQMMSLAFSNYVEKHVYNEHMVSDGYSMSETPVPLLASGNLCSRNIVDEEGDVVGQVPEDKYKFSVQAYFGKIDVRYYPHRRRSCTIGYHSEEGDDRSINHDDRYGLICEGFGFSGEGRLSCEGVEVSPGILNILSASSTRTCMQKTNDCSEKFPGVENRKVRGLCQSLYKSCMLNLPVVNEDKLRYATPRDRRTVHEAYYSASVYQKKKKKDNPQKLYKREGTYTQYENKCVRVFNKGIGYGKEKGSYKHDRQHFEKCLKENPQSYTGILMAQEKAQRAKTERELQAEKIKNGGN